VYCTAIVLRVAGDEQGKKQGKQATITRGCRGVAIFENTIQSSFLLLWHGAMDGGSGGTSAGYLSSRDERLVDAMAASLFENLSRTSSSLDSTPAAAAAATGEGTGASSATHDCDDDGENCVGADSREKPPRTPVLLDGRTDALVEKWSNEMLLHVRRMRPDDDGGVNAGNGSDVFLLDEQELVRRAVSRGTRRWKDGEPSLLFPGGFHDDTIDDNGNKKKKTTHKVVASVTTKSFSLFDSGGPSLLDSMITWDRIDECETLAEKLGLLEKVRHIDDLVYDWTDVNRVLREGLLQRQQQPDEAVDGTGSTAAASKKVLELHEKWFDMTRSRASSDFGPIQVDLCENIVDSISALVSQDQLQHAIADVDDDWIRKLAELLHRIWMDWMVRGLFVHDQRVEAIGRAIWKFVTTSAKPAESEAGEGKTASSSYAPSLVGIALMQLDPHARCMSSWLAYYLKPYDVSELVSGPAGSPLPSLVGYCETIMQAREDQNCLANHDDITCCYVLALIGSILDVLRASKFPFDLLLQGTGVAASSREVAIIRLFDLYVREMRLVRDTLSLSSDENNQPRHRHYRQQRWSCRALVASESIDTILRGCRVRSGEGTDPNLYQVMMSKLDALERSDEVNE